MQVAGLFIEAEDRTIFLKRIFKNNFKKSALLALWSGFINPPLQSLVNQCFSQLFEQLFSNENHEKYSPHLNLGVSLRFFEPTWILPLPIWWEYLNYSNITWKTKEISIKFFENSFGFEYLFKTKGQLKQSFKTKGPLKQSGDRRHF